MKRKIRRRCKCSCGDITNYGKVYIWGHNAFGNANWFGQKHSEKSKLKMSLSHKGIKRSEETKLKLSLANCGKKLSEEHKKNLSLAGIKYNPNYEYCDIWHDIEYKNDIRKDYCENANCKGNYKRLCNHHIYLDKKRCAPNDIITFCVSCHMILHHLLKRYINQSKRLYNNK